MLVPPNFCTTHPLGLSFLTVDFMMKKAGAFPSRFLAVNVFCVTLPRE